MVQSTWGHKGLQRAKSLACIVIGFLLLGIISNSYVFIKANALQSQPTTVLASGSIQYATASNATAWLHTQGTKILNGLNQEVIFNSFDTKTFVGYWSYGAQQEFFPSDVQYIRSKGFNAIRISLSMDSMVYQQSPGTPTRFNYYPKFWQVLDGLVSAAERYGVWLIIDHATGQPYWSPYFNGGDGNGMPLWMYDGSWSYGTRYATTDYWKATHDFFDLSNPTQENVRTAFKTMWKDIALRYRDRANVLFSLINEPLMDYRFSTTSEMLKFPDYYKSLMESTIDAIRSVDYNNHIVDVNDVYIYDGNAHWDLNKIIDRPNTLRDHHLYGNYFTSDTILNVETKFANYAWRYNQPIFFGEFGDVREGLMTVQQVTTFVQDAYILKKSDGSTQPVGWSYYRYDMPTEPTSDVWTALTSNLKSGILYP